MPVPIRKNLDDPTVPAWTAESRDPSASPVYVSLQSEAEGPVAFQVQLEGTAGKTGSLKAVGGGEVGEVVECLLRINEDGQSGPLTATFSMEGLTVAGIGIYDIEWEWQFQETGSIEWTTISTTQHRVYVGLGALGSPWSQEADAENNPWIDALEIACLWAKGETSEDGIASAITRGLATCGIFQYDTQNGDTFYTNMFGDVQLMEFIDRVNGGEGYGRKVNCTDCAAIVSTLANLLGCQLRQAQMGAAYKFPVREIISIGFEEWARPFDGYFSYHEVAWNGEIGADAHIYDACIYLDGSESPGISPPERLLPIQLKFGTDQPKDYRIRLILADEDGAENCVAEPKTEKNRTLD